MLAFFKLAYSQWKRQLYNKVYVEQDKSLYIYLVHWIEFSNLIIISFTDILT